MALAVGGCVALAVVGLVDPAVTRLGPPCPLQALTGLDCPLCGATRATHQLLRGDVVAALDLNALYVVLLPVMAVAVAWWLLRGRRPPAATWGRWAVVASTAAFFVARNLPWAPFTWLGT